MPIKNLENRHLGKTMMLSPIFPQMEIPSLELEKLLLQRGGGTLSESKALKYIKIYVLPQIPQICNLGGGAYPRPIRSLEFNRPTTPSE